jgi:hypothetical protein
MSGLRIISADERLAGQGAIKGLIAGNAKVGKTSLLWTLDPASTLLVNLEAGELSVQGWPGDSIEIRDWLTARDVACYLGGPNPAMRPDQTFSEAHYNHVVSQYGETSTLTKYKTLFIDSITEASRLCWQHCTGQPDSFSEKTGKPDVRGTYGLLGREMIAWLKQLQHAKNCNVWFVCLLDSKKDDFGRIVHELQIEGSKTGLELPGIVDQVITMAELSTEDGAQYRAFVCTRPNPWNYPAGDRSCKLEQLEPPHLGKLMDKILNSERRNPASYLYALEG